MAGWSISERADAFEPENKIVPPSKAFTEQQAAEKRVKQWTEEHRAKRKS
jgi:hypothetical protein